MGRSRGSRRAASGLGNRLKSPTSAQTPAADSVSMPRKQRSRAITGAWLYRDRLLERGDSVVRRPTSSSTAAR